MRIGYADPPYPGCAHLYKHHPDYAGEVDHRQLVERLQSEFDAWVLHTHVAGLRMMEREHILPDSGVRICQWFKPFAAFKPNVKIAYAYEPVIIKPARTPIVPSKEVSRDWIEQPDEVVRQNITMKKGLTGVKPERVCHWIFQVMGLRPGDDLVDMFPGSGAVQRAWESWKANQ